MKGCEKKTYQQIQETFISNKIEVNMKTNKREIFYTDRTIHHEYLIELLD